MPKDQQDEIGALQDLFAVRELGDESAELGLALARVWRRLGKADEAESEFGSALGAVREGPCLDAWAALCLACRAEADWHDLATAEALGAFGDEPDILHERLVSLVNSKRLAEALELAATMAERFPGDHRGHECRALVLRGMSRPEEGLLAVDAALRLDPDCGSCRNDRGLLLDDLGRREEALREFDRAVEVGEQLATVHNNRAVTLLRMGRWEEALPDCERALALEPDQALALRNHVLILVKLKRYEAAAGAAERAIAMGAANEQVRHWQSSALTRLGRYEEALGAAANVAALPGIRLRLEALRALGRTEEARAIAREEARSEPPPGQEMAYAWLAALGGDRDRALALLPDEAEMRTLSQWYDRACVHALLGDTEEALDVLDRVAEAGLLLPPDAPPDPDLASLENDPRYERIRQRLIQAD